MGIFSGNKNKNILKFVTPSTATWKEGLFTGNGNVGLNVYGGVGREVVLVNSPKLFWKGNTGVLPDVSDKVKNIIKALGESKYREAESTLSNALKAKNYKPECAYPLPLCDFVLTQDLTSSYCDYARKIDLETSEVSTEFRVKNVKYTRDIFASRVDDTICYNITASGSKNLKGSFTLKMHDLVDSFDFDKCESIEVNLPYVVKTDKEFVYFAMRNEDGTDFGCVARVICLGGTLTKDANTFYFKNADKVFILAKIFVMGQKEKEIERIKEELSLIKNPYDKLLKDHTAIYSKLVKKADINLGGKISNSVEESLLEVRTKEGLSLGLLENLYNFGKHLYLCMGESYNLSCGAFNGSFKAFDSTTSNFLELERMFDFVFKCGLASTIKPVFEKFYDNLDDYKKNSTRLFGCKGIFVPSIEAPESGLPGDTSPKVVMNYNVGAYISSLIYNYFVYTLDRDFMLEKGYEFVEEVGMFYEDFLKVNKSTSTFETQFGYSPFSTSSNIGISGECSIANNCAGDFACAKQVFSILADLSLSLDKDEKEIEKWQKLLEQIPDFEVDKDGILKEYSGKTFETNNASPHIPHLFPYNIGFRTLENRNDFDDIVANTVKTRFVKSFGTLTAGPLLDMATALSTCGDAKDSFELLTSLVKTFLRPNLMFDNFDFLSSGVGEFKNFYVLNTDKNIGLLTSLQNMFVNSAKNNIYLFKVLPSDLQKGSVSNFYLDNQVKFDMEFNNRRGAVKVVLRAPKNMSVKVYLPKGFKKVKGIDQTLVDLQSVCINNLSLPENKNVVLKIYYKN